MRNLWIPTLAVAGMLLALVCPSEVDAQAKPITGPSNPSSRPGFSPYLNLLRRDVNPALSYYGLVKPEIAANNAIQQLSQQQSLLANQMLQEQNPNVESLPTTGHSAGYQTQSKYFQTKGAKTTGGSVAGAAAPKSPRR